VVSTTSLVGATDVGLCESVVTPPLAAAVVVACDVLGATPVGTPLVGAVVTGATVVVVAPVVGADVGATKSGIVELPNCGIVVCPSWGIPVPVGVALGAALLAGASHTKPFAPCLHTTFSLVGGVEAQLVVPSTVSAAAVKRPAAGKETTPRKRTRAGE
jgi:hypothetical protein